MKKQGWELCLQCKQPLKVAGYRKHPQRPNDMVRPPATIVLKCCCDPAFWVTCETRREHFERTGKWINRRWA